MDKYNDSTPIAYLTVGQLKDLILSLTPEAKKEVDTKEPPRGKINGIRGLAKYLGLSVPTAQRLKNKKSFPFYTSGNKVYFFSDEVNAGLKVEATKKFKKERT